MAAAPFDLVQEAKKLIRFNTQTWESNANCAVYVGSLMRNLGLAVSYQETRLGEVLFYNVIGASGKGKDPILLTTHLDTVAPGDLKLWTKTGGDPWALTKKGDSLYGLGTADTKLDMLAKLFAIGRLGVTKLKRPIMVLGTFGEESGLRGAAQFCQGEIPRPHLALVGEPSKLEVVTRHKGLAIMEVIFKSKGLFRPGSQAWVYEARFIGQASHSSTPDLGENALKMAIAFLETLRKKHKKIFVLNFEAGQGHNVIPASARLRFSLGDESPKAAFASKSKVKIKAERVAAGWYPTLPWEELLDSIQVIQEALAPLEKLKDNDFNPPKLTWNLTQLLETKEGWLLVVDARPLPGQDVRKAVRKVEQKLWEKWGAPGPVWQFRLERDNPPLDLKADSPVLKEIKSAMRMAKLPYKTGAKSGCSEAGLYNRLGIPAVVFGPGISAGNIHRPNESVPLSQIKAAAKFYEAFIKKTCF